MIAEQIVWLDHCEPDNAGNVWWTADDIEDVAGPAIVTSVGWVTRETPDWLVIVSQITDDGCMSQPLVIVKACILRRATLQL